MLEEVDGGVLFIDEVYQLDPKNNKDGADIMNLLLTFAEDKRGERSVVLAGYRDEVETLLSFNPGLASRSPNTWVFEDYLEPELRSIYHKMMSDRKMVVESASPSVASIVASRLAYGVGQRGFGNARAVRNQIEQAIKRQEERLSMLIDGGETPSAERWRRPSRGRMRWYGGH